MWKLFSSKKTPQKKQQKRRFDAGLPNRTLSDWIKGPSQLFSEEVRFDLPAVRARSRDASINDPYARRYFRALSTNVVGPHGFKMLSDVRDPNNAPDVVANNKIQQQWNKWIPNVSVENDCLTDATKLFLETTARDGEAFVQILRGNQFHQGITLRFIDADQVDPQYNERLSNGNTIRSSIEYDEWGRKVAVWVWEYHPNDPLKSKQNVSNNRVRIPISNIIHGIYKDRAQQGRGFPWISAALTNLTHLKKYQESELIAARVNSGKMGFYTRPKGEQVEGEVDDTDENAVIREVEPGTFDVLPEGWGLDVFDTNNPNANFANFCKQVLHGVAASLNITYHTLTSDISNANYSSTRQGSIDERDYFRSLQHWLVEVFLSKVYEAWLEVQLLKGSIGLPVERFDKFNAPSWRPRTWAWMDPSKEASALKIQLDYKLRSMSDVMTDLGLDFTQVMNQIAEEKALMEKLGITQNEVVSDITKQQLLQGMPLEDGTDDE